MKVIELFSGIGGFSKGIERAGYKISEHYFSEIDKHAIANYKYNFQNAEYIGDIKSIQSRDFGAIDIITFGSPCQDFSLAGKRKGLEGERSSLIGEAIRLISDIRPSVFIWENVKGAFSSNSGADFWAILQAFANIGGYRFEWQLLNTKWFLPQNRERIYLIGHFAGRSKPGVFPIGNEIAMDHQRTAEKQIASCIQGSGGHIANGESKGMNLIAQRGHGF
ncbi:MAG: DNA (cytosine-5-)-methyltransferase, partial [Acetivibrio sp.]